MECPRCAGMKPVDPFFIKEAKKTFAELMAELVVFAHENKIDHREMPVLQKVARTIRAIEMI